TYYGIVNQYHGNEVRSMDDLKGFGSDNGNGILGGFGGGGSIVTLILILFVVMLLFGGKGGFRPYEEE
ncbi:MAG TPA: hypothetical protein DDW86_07285, partial [Clostridiales bacterium]|nr:hypothetical protein [Clostridiales bacterium]